MRVSVLTGILVVALVALRFPVAVAQDYAAIRVGEATDISLVDVEKSYRDTVAYEAKCTNSAKSSDEQARCKERLTVIDHNVCDSYETTGFYYYWAPAPTFKDGTEALEELQEHARTGKEFGGHVIAHIDSALGEERFALCDVTSVAGKEGPPRACVTVGIIIGDKAWLRGGNPDQTVCYASYSESLTGAININFEIHTDINVGVLAQAIEKMLTNDLVMTFDTDTRDFEGKLESVDITAVAPIRDSRILARGWRESLDYHVTLAQIDPPPGSNAKAYVRLDAVAHAMVSRLALGNLVDYHGLDDAQRGIYADTLDHATATAIASICRQYAQTDARNIECK
jgi:hypothetical protein